MSLKNILGKSPLICAVVIVALIQPFATAKNTGKSELVKTTGHTFPALGAADTRKVEVPWNRYHDTEGLYEILQALNKAFPNLTQLYSIGKSTDGRDIWCLEVTAFDIGNARRKSGMYIDGNIHGNEVQTGETVAYTAWYLCHQYGRLETITGLLDNRVFYLLPTINPDGRDNWLTQVEGSHSSRSGMEPFNNDRDGVADEDDCDDLNGDGEITLMRIKDPHGRYKLDPDYPEYLMVRVDDDQQGQYTILGSEGIDNDGDGRINEDRRGGYDMNRNWAFDWQPEHVQRGAMDYPFSQNETRAVAAFILKHTNIAAAQSYHNTGGMILRGPGREGGEKQPADEAVMAFISDRGAEILPYYIPKVIYRDLYTVWGGELDWLYGGRGILTFTNELWSSKNLYKTGNSASNVEETDFIKYVLMGDGLVRWQPFDHPTYGKIEIGGTKRQWGRIPPSFLMEEELHRNMAFTLYHADMMPLIEITDIDIEKLDDELFKVWVTIENKRLIPTRTGQDVVHHISSPDIVSLTGPDVEVLSAGIVSDRYFKRVTAVKRRPQRVEVDAIPGMSEVTVQFVATGKGRFTVTVDSTKAGLHKKNASLRQ